MEFQSLHQVVYFFVIHFFFYLGSRSVRRDLEMQAAIVTTNRGLRKRLADEEMSLIDLSSPFNEKVASDPDRRPALWVRTTMKLFKTFF